MTLENEHRDRFLLLLTIGMKGVHQCYRGNPQSLGLLVFLLVFIQQCFIYFCFDFVCLALFSALFIK